MAQRNTDHKCMKPGAWGRTSATLLIVLGLGLGLSGCSVLSMFSPFGDFGDDGKDVMLIEEGDLSRQTLGLSTTAVAVPTTNAAPLLAPGAAPAQSASALAAANAAANTAIGAAGAGDRAKNCVTMSAATSASSDPRPSPSPSPCPAARRPGPSSMVRERPARCSAMPLPPANSPLKSSRSPTPASCCSSTKI